MSDDNQELNERYEFWRSIEIPLNPDYMTDGSAPANPVTVADRFMHGQSVAAHLGSEAEELAEQIEDLEDLIADTRKAILSANMKDFKASWNAELIDAFVDERANKVQRDLLDSTLAILRPKRRRLNTLRTRLKALERNLEWAKQYVDFDKHQSKVRQGMR